MEVRNGYNPVKQREETRGGGLDALPTPIAASRLTIPMAGMKIISFSSTTSKELQLVTQCLSLHSWGDQILEGGR